MDGDGRRTGRRRSAIDFGASQAGDISTGGIAGNDYIANNLADIPEGLARVLADNHEYSQLMVTSLERMQAHLQRSIDRVRDDLDLYRVTDAHDRIARRAEADGRLRELVDQVDAAVAATQATARRLDVLSFRVTLAIVVLSIVVGVSALVLMALVYDRLAVVLGLVAGLLLALRMRGGYSS